MPRKKRRWVSFTLRTLLIVVTLLGVGLGWRVNRANRQREAVKIIQGLGGRVQYDFEYREPGSKKPAKKEMPWEPRWLLGVVGVDFFHSVVYVDSGTKSGAVPRKNDRLACLERLSDLRVIMLYGADANDQTLAHVANLSRLEQLLLCECPVLDGPRTAYPQVTVRGLERLAELDRLKFLYVDGAPLDDESLRTICRIHSLEDLTLQGPACHFTDAGLRDIATLHRLRCLRFGFGYGRTEFSDEGISRLGSLEHLEEAWLRGGEITDRGLLALERLPRLKRLMIQCNKISPEGVKRFEKQSSATIQLSDHFTYTSEVCKLVAFVGRPRIKDVPPDATLAEVGLTSDEQKRLFEVLQDAYGFDNDKPRGEEFARRAAALDDPSIGDLVELLNEMVGR